MITVYGIPNCDTIKKARTWLEGAGIAYRFHDYRKDGVNAAMIDAWAQELGWEALLNRRGTTWRGLPAAETADVDHDKAVALMAAHPALIKRPLFDLGSERLVGFTPGVQARLSGKA